MESEKRKRKSIRSTFTKTINIILEELRKDICDNELIKTKAATLERLFADLDLLDNQILNAEYETDEEYELEWASIEEYKEKMDSVRVKIQMHFSIETPPLNIAESRTSSPISSRRKLKLPKIELVKFGGDVKDWLSFWSQFQRIHTDDDLEPEDKFQYLIQATISGTRAREIVDSFPPTAQNYEKVIEGLKARFGREELQIEFYVRELLGLVVKSATEKMNRNIVQLYDKLESYLRALESIGMTSDKYSAMLFPLVESCIPENILRIWLRSQAAMSSDKEEESTYSFKLKQLLSFLKNEVEGEERISLAKTGFKLNIASNKTSKTKNEHFIPTANDLFASQQKVTKDESCLFCDKAHSSRDCFIASKMPLKEKQDLLKKKRSCFTCLKIGHMSKDCRSNVKCIICWKRHWAILCPEILKKQEKRSESEIHKELENQGLSSLSSSCSDEVLLQTVLVKLEENGKKRIIRALFDTGSQRSYIVNDIAEEMKCQPVRKETLIHKLFSGVTTKRENHSCYNIRISSLTSNFSCKLEVLNQPEICGTVGRLKPGLWMDELKQRGIHLTDVGERQSRIEVLIGSDVAGSLFTGKLEKLRCGLVAMETLLGWVVMGKIQEKQIRDTHSNIVTSLLTLPKDIDELWKLEAIGISDKCMSKTKDELETAVLQHFERTVKVNEEGRYEIHLPWLDNFEDLPDNKTVAEKRLYHTTSRLEAKGKLEDYNAVFQDWELEGIIEEVPEAELDIKGHYLPHRGVFREHATTSLRPVFDASCKSKGFPSLNDCLAKGPNMIELIPSSLLKFRENRIGVISDIKKAFLQISIDKDDRDCLRFVWWKNRENHELKIFRHCRVVFGVNCSPFLLGAIIDYHLKNYGYEIPKKLRSSFYVDNCATSVNTREELVSFIAQSTQIMSEAKFELRGWEYSETPENTVNFDVKQEPTKVLGLLWDKLNDTLFCDISGVDSLESPITRRSILSVCQKVFDPMGFCCPFTLIPKQLLQETWKLKLSWDSEVPEETKYKFLKWVKELTMLAQARVPRSLMLNQDMTYSLHIFSDACQSSYAAVIFLRCQNDHQVFVRFVMAKSRVAPLKKITIPRLELLACNIAARLASFVKECLGLDNIKEYFWTDSTTALCWIQREDLWGVFVKNRVNEIRKLSKIEDWHHIPGEQNPADLPSRGCSAKKLIQLKWWEGPEWLKASEEEWPKFSTEINEKFVNEEKKKTIVTSLSCTSPENPWFILYFSKYSKILRMVAWVRRFVNNARKSLNDRQMGELTVAELNAAEKYVVKYIQKESFPNEKVTTLKTLCVFRDEEGILRVKTKLSEKKDEKNFIFPMILPSKHKIVELLIMEQHLLLSHAGLHVLLSRLRENFWILKGRKTIRRVLLGCIRCKRHEAKPIQTPSVALPKDRVTETAAFEVVGVDLAGPLYLKDKRKSWVVLFTCAVYRAVHLELIMSLSTEGFLLGLRRFIGRRGRPVTIYSDNGTNFVGAENLFKAIDWKTIEVYASTRRIQWKFIPPASPWWGGFWERLVQSLKKLLRRVLGQTSLLYEELQTILIDCEATVNARPLTYISETSDLIPLTPSMFLSDSPTVGVTDLDHIDEICLNKRIRYQQELRKTLRERFRIEYLSQLLQRPGKSAVYQTIKVGDIVLLEGDGKRTFWPMAKVIEICPSKDKNVRLVRLKTSKGEFFRPVRRIYPLEIRSSLDEENNIKKDDVVAGTDEPTHSKKGTVSSDEVTHSKKRTVSSNEPNHSKERTVTTRSGRLVKIPLRLLDT